MADADRNSPAMPKLGLLFWVVWWAVFALVTATFLATLLYLIKNDLWSMWTGMLATLTFTVIIIALAMTPYLVGLRRGAVPRMREPHRRYMARFLPPMIAYVVILIPAITYFQDARPTGVIAWAVAIAPVIPLLFAIRAIMLYYKEEDDEFVKATAVQSHLLATGFTMTICTAYGFLDMFGLVPHAALWEVFPMWALCLIPAQFIVQRKFR